MSLRNSTAEVAEIKHTLAAVVLFCAVNDRAVAAIHIVHHALHRTTPTTPNSGVAWIGVAWICTWLASVLIAHARGQKIDAVLLYMFLGWIFPPIALLLSFAKGPGDQKGSTLSAPTEQQKKISAQVKAIETGDLPEVTPVGIVPDRDEKFFWEQRCQYGQTYKQSVSRGSTPALYIPLGHGIRMRAGGYRGSSQQVTNFVWGPSGTVYVSQERIAFKSDTGEVAVAGFDTILGYDAFPDGLGLQLKVMPSMMQFKTGDECLGILFEKVIQRRNHQPPSAPTKQIPNT